MTESEGARENLCSVKKTCGLSLGLEEEMENTSSFISCLITELQVSAPRLRGEYYGHPTEG